MTKLNFAIIGCGRIAKRHAEEISKIGNLAAVCDNKIEYANELSTKYNSIAYNNIDDLLNSKKEVDLISICTPNYLHAEHTIKALNAGYNVLCEKPMAIKVKDAEKMMYEAQKTNKRLFIVKQNRFNPPIEALKKAIEENKLGKIFNVQLNCFWNRNNKYFEESDWKGRKELDGGTLYTQFSHFIDLLYWLVGDIVDAKAFMGNFTHENIIEFEDNGSVIIRFENGSIGTINFTVSSYAKNMEGSITIFGEKGTVKVGGQYLNELEYQSIEDFKIEGLDNSRKANDYGFYQGSMSNHDLIYKNVVDVFQNNAQIATNALEGYKVVQIIEKIYKSI